MKRRILLGSAALLSVAQAHAGQMHHRHRLQTAEPYRAAQPYHAAASQEPYAGLTNNPYAGYKGPGSDVLNATVRAEREPGVTLELAPDAKETATGGPVGGPPGFDGS